MFNMNSSRKFSKLSVMYATLLLSATSSGAQATEICPSISSDEYCPAGCWLATTEISFPISNDRRQCISVGYGFFSPENSNLREACPTGRFSDTENAQDCEKCKAGSYAPREGSMACELCPQGSYSDRPGSAICNPCIDEYYAGQGANAAEIWNGEHYCAYNAPFTPSTSPSTSPSATPTAFIPTAFPTAQPSVAPSAAPTMLRTTMAPTKTASNAPTVKGDEDDDADDASVEHEELIFQEEQASSVCALQENTFEWHQQCRQCPSDVGQALLTVTNFLVLAALITVLQSYVPLCSTSIVWVGLEYLHMLYLMNYMGVEWHPVADVIFGTILPMFALDFNANISVQCLFGWSKEFDQMFMIAWPVFLWLLVLAMAKITKNRAVHYTTAHRWLIASFFIGFPALVQTSKDALDFSAIIEAMFSGVPTKSWYSAIFGIIGLILYVFVLPGIFLTGLNRSRRSEQGDQETCDDQDVESTTSRVCLGKGRSDSSRSFWFLVMALFSSIQTDVEAWKMQLPTFYLLRKMAFLMVLVFYPESRAVLWGSLAIIVVLDVLYVLVWKPFTNEGEKELEDAKFRTSTAYIVLLFCTILMLAMSFGALNFESSKSIGVSMAIVLGASLFYWLIAVWYARKLLCEDCPCFATKAQEIYTTMTPPSTGEDDEDETSEDGPRSNNGVGAMHDIPLSGAYEIPVIPPNASNVSNASSRGSRGREIVLGGDNDDYKATKRSALVQEFQSRNNNRASVFRGDSIISDQDDDQDDDMETVLEEVWIDSAGNEVERDSRKWIDSETGMRVTRY
ncbi:MAG: hypothetical protein SGILL_003331 [Bacillariaceae sp.]